MNIRTSFALIAAAAAGALAVLTIEASASCPQDDFICEKFKNKSVREAVRKSAAPDRAVRRAAKRVERQSVEAGERHRTAAAPSASLAAT